MQFALLFKYLEEMRKDEHLANSDLALLLTLIRRGENAYGVTIASELEAQTGREAVFARIYAALGRLQQRGLVISSRGEPTAERGGRAKRYFRITGAGLREVRDARRPAMNLWTGLSELKGERA